MRKRLKKTLIIPMVTELIVGIFNDEMKTSILLYSYPVFKVAKQNLSLYKNIPGKLINTRKVLKKVHRKRNLFHGVRPQKLLAVNRILNYIFGRQ